jgi:tryptophan halogenase
VLTQTENIVIVGGGSSGWMTAGILAKFFPNKNITVLEDPATPTIGVGEATYDAFIHFCKVLEIDEYDFFRATDASIKLGLKFVGFNGGTDDEFTYMFGSPDLSGTQWGLEDWQIRKQLHPNIPLTDYSETYFFQAHLLKHNTYNENLDGSLGPFNSDLDRALHFDSAKFGEWLKNQYCLPRGVNHIPTVVQSCSFDDRGYVAGLHTDHGYIQGDLYVDCTGFQSLLLGKFLKEPFNSLEGELPNNRAWATQLPYVDKEQELTPYSTCTALGNGWCWNVPLWSRLGAGYVYSDKHASPEDALAEFKNYLCQNLVIPRSSEIVESLHFRDIQMRTGIHERVWVNNVVAIGLSAGFIEPLESTGLFTVHEFLYQLVKSLENGAVSRLDIDMFNDYTQSMFKHLCEFIKVHYCFSKRCDTPYWVDNLNRDWDIQSAKTNLHRAVRSWTVSTPLDFSEAINWIVGGFGYTPLNSVSMKLGEIRNRQDYKQSLSHTFHMLDVRKQRWEEAALSSVSFLHHMQTKYHSVTETSLVGS